ncbi:hypothetical protein RUM43_000274 [Polyplax serrata]|uniref:Uncharacterized protein n=1 Tax=Polyplax serrata TaxID=468196 RepID=A0AAN8SD54_POLSC
MQSVGVDHLRRQKKWRKWLRPVENRKLERRWQSNGKKKEKEDEEEERIFHPSNLTGSFREWSTGNE